MAFAVRHIGRAATATLATAYTGGQHAEALRWQRQAVTMAAEQTPALLPEVLYDLAVILQANGAGDEALPSPRDCRGSRAGIDFFQLQRSPP